jgi:hypothetical protein
MRYKLTEILYSIVNIVPPLKFYLLKLWKKLRRTSFFIIKPTRCTSFPILLRYETLHVSGSSSAHHQECIHCSLGIGVYHTSLKTAFEQDQDGTPGPARKLSSNLYDIRQCRVYSEYAWWWAEELPETCRVSCQSNLGKLVHLVGFIIKKFVTMYGHMNVKNAKNEFLL